MNASRLLLVPDQERGVLGASLSLKSINFLKMCPSFSGKVLAVIVPLAVGATLMISKQTLLFRCVYAHLFVVCNMFSLSEGMVGATPLTTGPTASMTEETAVRPRSPPER